MLRRLFFSVLLLGIGSTVAVGLGLVFLFRYYARDLPDFASIEDYRPAAVSSVYANNGVKIAEFYEKRRYPVKLAEVPRQVQLAFVAAEDSNFYSHPGIDLISIFRALLKNLRAGAPTQGGSTITQQVVKNLLLSPERSIERKVKEAILSYRLEKRLSKEEILQLYLNEIFFGNTAYGVKAAAALYFRKELNDLTLGEAALLAGLPKAPSRYSPLLNAERAYKRQRYVLGQMVAAGFVSQEEADAAKREKPIVYKATDQNIFHAPHYVTEVRQRMHEEYPDLQLDSAGLSVNTAVDLELTGIVERELSKGIRTVDKRRGWRGVLASFGTSGAAKYNEKYGVNVAISLTPLNIYPALITRLDFVNGRVEIQVGNHQGYFEIKEAQWASKRLDAQDVAQYGVTLERTLRVGDVVEVSLVGETAPPALSGERREGVAFQLDQTPELEGAAVVLDPHSGEVLAAVGGYDYARSKFNRATRMLRQPGSAFKPIVYLAAIDGFGYTPSTIVNDTPRTFRVGTQVWSPSNFDSKFMGHIPLFRALEQSRNLVSADLVSRIGLDAPIDYAKRMGIVTPLKKNLSLSLGSGEVTVLELVRAYGVLPAGGMLFPSTFVRNVQDRDGKIVVDGDATSAQAARQVISSQSAFVMATMMRGVVERGTATRLREMKREIAGKTGTTNDQMDAWFVGFNPDYVCGVWIGFDTKREIGKKQTGGVVSAPIFMNIMQPFLLQREQAAYDKVLNASEEVSKELTVPESEKGPAPPAKFVPPDGVELFWVNKYSGQLSSPEAANAIPQYFLQGTEPPVAPTVEEESSSSYLEDMSL